MTIIIECMSFKDLLVKLAEIANETMMGAPAENCEYNVEGNSMFISYTFYTRSIEDVGEDYYIHDLPYNYAQHMPEAWRLSERPYIQKAESYVDQSLLDLCVKDWLIVSDYGYSTVLYGVGIDTYADYLNPYPEEPIHHGMIERYLKEMSERFKLRQIKSAASAGQ